MREENSFHHPITHQPENIGQIWDSCSIDIVVFGFFSFGRQESPSEQCSNSSAIPPYWLFNRGFPNWILIIRNIFGSIINYNSVQSLHFSQPTGVFLSLLIWDFPNPRYIFESILKEEVPKISAAFGAAFGWPLAAPVTFSRIKSFTDQAVKRNELQVLWGQEKKVNAANTCYCTVYATNTWHFATFGNFTTDFAPTAMGFFAHKPGTEIFWWLLGDGGWTVYHIHFLFFASLREIIYIHNIYTHNIQI